MVTIDELCKELNSKLGISGGVIRSGSDIPEQEYNPTGIYSMDNAFQGVPIGKYVSIEGHAGTYKTTLALRIANQFEKVLYLDCEHRLDIQWADTHCNINNMAIAKPRDMEETFDIAMVAAEEQIFDFIVIDSISMIAPLDELDKDTGDNAKIAVRAAHTNRFMRCLQSYLGIDGSPTVVGINHLTSTMNSYGKQYDIPCGRGQGYTTSLRIALRNVKRLYDDDDDSEQIGETIQWSIIKRSIPADKTSGSFDAFNTSGSYLGRSVVPGDIDELVFIANELSKAGVLNKRGGWYTINDEKFQGNKNVREPIKSMIDERYWNSIGDTNVIEESGTEATEEVSEDTE